MSGTRGELVRLSSKLTAEAIEQTLFKMADKGKMDPGSGPGMTVEGALYKEGVQSAEGFVMENHNLRPSPLLKIVFVKGFSGTILVCDSVF